MKASQYLPGRVGVPPAGLGILPKRSFPCAISRLAKKAGTEKSESQILNRTPS